MIELAATITGDEALMSKLNQLSTKGSRRALRASLTVGQAEYRQAIVGQIPEARTRGHSNDAFRQAIGSRFVSARGQGLVAAKTGVNVGKDKGWLKVRKQTPKGQRRAAYRSYRAAKPGAPHFHLLALGTAIRRNRFGSNRGLVRSGDYVPKAAAVASVSAGPKMELRLRERIYAEAMKEGVL